MSDWADEKAMECLFKAGDSPIFRYEDMKAAISCALRDMQREMAEECCKLVCSCCASHSPVEKQHQQIIHPVGEARYACTAFAIRERFLKEEKWAI